MGGGDKLEPHPIWRPSCLKGEHTSAHYCWAWDSSSHLHIYEIKWFTCFFPHKLNKIRVDQMQIIITKLLFNFIPSLLVHCFSIFKPVGSKVGKLLLASKLQKSICFSLI